MNVLTLSATEPGRLVGRRLPYPHVHGDPGRTLRERWGETDAFVVVLAVGATVRLLAPLLEDKHRDPAVVCVDDAGRYAVVVSGGHARSGNQLATEVAAVLGAQPVVTTATDRLGVPALDQLPGLTASGAPGAVATVTAALLAGDDVDVVNPVGWPLPGPLRDRTVATGVGPGDDLGEGPAGGRRRPRVVITDRCPPEAPHDRSVVLLHPPSLVVGVGTSTDAGPDEAVAALDAVLAREGLARPSVAEVATVDRRAGHPAVTALAVATGAPLRSFDSATLASIAVPTPSERVRAAVGTPSVAEASALAAAGPGASLAVPKSATARVTVAVARRLGPRGSVSVVGLGPGGGAHRTPAAVAAVRHAEVVVGYHGYVEQCRDLLTPGQEVTGYPLGAEMERARAALQAAAAGRRVALVCSGDPGVYAMASPLLELADETGPDGVPVYAGVDVDVVPGITASLAASAALGAPLGHDHAVISLSDLHTPWELIESRVTAAAATDFVLVLYNPRSLRRTWQIEKVQAILLEHRPPETPVGLVTDASRPAQQVVRTTLGELPCDEVTMTTCVVVGSSTTRLVAGRMVTPRGYDRW